jgi:hypothetical protein
MESREVVGMWRIMLKKAPFIIVLLMLGMFTPAGLLQINPACAATSASVRFVQAAIISPKIDIYIDGKLVKNNLQFGSVTAYFPVDAKDHVVVVTSAGGSITAPIIRQDVLFFDANFYTLVAVGDTNPAVTPSLIPFVDDNQIYNTKARVRIYHLADNAGPVSLSEDGKVLIPNQQYQGASDYLNLDPGNSKLTITLLGQQNTQLTSVNDFQPNTVTSLFAIGLVNNTSVNTAFRFVVQTTDGLPSGFPVTGYVKSADTFSSFLQWLGIIIGIVLVGSGMILLGRSQDEKSSLTGNT